MTIDMRERLREASSTIETSRPLLDAARTSGRRRLARRRVTIASVTIAAVAVGAALVPGQWNRLTNVIPTSGASDPLGVYWRDTPTGDLALDSSFTSAALSAWTNGLSTAPDADRGVFDDLRGSAVVVWAGMTPAGPAAVVAQRAYLHRHANIALDHEGIQTLLGFVGPGTNDKPTLFSDSYAAPGSTAGRQVGGSVTADNRTFVILETDEALAVSRHWLYSDNGTRRDWAPIKFHDGAASVSVDGAATADDLRFAQLPFGGFDDIRFVSVAGTMQSTLIGSGEGALTWPFEKVIPLNGSQTWPTTGDAASDLDAIAAVVQPLLESRVANGSFSSGGTSFKIAGQLPDSHHVAVVQFQIDSDPVHVWAVITDSTGRNPQLIHGGVADPSAALPVHIRLPDGQGWVVAAYGSTLRYRVAGGQWVDVGSDAALLPAGATDVEVSTKSGLRTTVSLAG